MSIKRTEDLALLVSTNGPEDGILRKRYVNDGRKRQSESYSRMEKGPPSQAGSGKN